MNYTARYMDYLKKAGLALNELPEDLQQLIRKFDTALEHWNNADESGQRKFHAALLQSDALIAAGIFKLKKEPDNMDTTKLNEVKAKMLLLRKKTNKK